MSSTGRILETERLYLRNLKKSDFVNLYNILSDRETMAYYPGPFSEEKVRRWIDWNLDSYSRFNLGLWAVILKEGELFLGECGITMQDIDGEMLPELGYHMDKRYQNRGYATEAAKACMNYAFHILNLNKIYTYTKYDNQPSIKVARKNGMTFIKEFEKTIMGETVREVLYGGSAD